MTNWNVGQKVAGIANIGIYSYENKWIENLIEIDKVYEILSKRTGMLHDFA